MQVTAVHNTTIQPLHNLLPMQRKPQYGFVDFLGELSSGAPTIDANGNIITDDSMVEYDSMRGCVTARSLFVPHDNLIQGQSYGNCQGTNRFPQVIWQSLTATTVDNNGCAQSFINETGYPFEVCCINFLTWNNDFGGWNENEVSGYALFSPVCQGFTFLLGLHPDTQFTHDSNFAIRFHMTDSSGTDGRWYSVSMHAGWGVLHGYNDQPSLMPGVPDDTPGNWHYFDNIKQGADFNKLILGAQVTATQCISGGLVTDIQWGHVYAITIRMMGGQLTSVVGNETTPYVYPQLKLTPAGYPYALIDAVNVRGYNNHCGMWSVHPTKWIHGATILSAEQNLGFVPEQQQIKAMYFAVQYVPNQSPTPTDITQIGYTPAGFTATAAFNNLNGTQLQYLLTFNGAQSGTFHVDDFGNPIGYQDLTSAVRAVSGFMPGVPYMVFGEPANILPEIIEITHEFDWNTLSISSSCSLTMNNYEAYWSAAMQNYLTNGWVDQNGHVGITIQLGIYGFLGPYTQFTGFWNTDFEDHMESGGTSRVTIHGQDCWISLDVPVFNLPWFDGWNVVYAMYYLAQQGGIPLSRMAFQNQVNTTNPYAPNADGSQSYYLPVGPAGTPLTRFGGGARLKDIMRKLSIYVGYLLYFDVNANLQFKQYSLGNFMLTKTFYYTGQDSGAGHLNEIWAGEYVGSLREVRNNVTVIGVNVLDGLWLPIVSHAVDEGSVYNTGQLNFKGFVDPLVWSDSQFASGPFAQAAANALLSFLDLPKREVPFTTWLQADSPTYPLDVFQVFNPKSGAGNSALKFLTVGVKHRIQKGTPPTTQIRGRWIPSGSA